MVMGASLCGNFCNGALQGLALTVPPLQWRPPGAHSYSPHTCSDALQGLTLTVPTPAVAPSRGSLLQSPHLQWRPPGAGSQCLHPATDLARTHHQLFSISAHRVEPHVLCQQRVMSSLPCSSLHACMCRVKAIPGATVEHNKFCVSVHFRNCAAESYEAVVQAVKDTLQEHSNLKASRGRKVLEIQPQVLPGPASCWQCKRPEWRHGTSYKLLQKGMEHAYTAFTL